MRALLTLGVLISSLQICNANESVNVENLKHRVKMFYIDASLIGKQTFAFAESNPSADSRAELCLSLGKGIAAIHILQSANINLNDSDFAGYTHIRNLETEPLEFKVKKLIWTAEDHCAN